MLCDLLSKYLINALTLLHSVWLWNSFLWVIKIHLYPNGDPPKGEETPLAMGDCVMVCLPDKLAELQTKKSLRPRMCRTLQLFSFKMGGLQTFPWAELNKKWFQKQHKVQVPFSSGKDCITIKFKCSSRCLTACSNLLDGHRHGVFGGWEITEQPPVAQGVHLPLGYFRSGKAGSLTTPRKRIHGEPEWNKLNEFIKYLDRVI